MDQVSITVFTPTYNRAYRLGNLYTSLLNLNYTNFEWIVVDDGSTDDTETLMESFQKEGKIRMIYKKQDNQGKHVAINKGVELAGGKLFFIVDSDDELTENSLSVVNEKYIIHRDNPLIAGVVGIRGIKKGDRPVDKSYDFEELICSPLEFRYTYNITGDMAEVFVTDILKKYPFPVFEGENFCTESLIWNRMAKDYQLVYFNSVIYIGEYLEDGLTAKYWNLIKKNPKASALYYSELSASKIPLRHQLSALEHYWTIVRNDKNKTFYEKLKPVSFLKSVYVLAALFISHRFKKI
ncbi:MAG: glycosyltransferase family 2 protein [Flavobacteriaceae bacterium]|jgi:glycosyltransferase involved in cell wall biosynthesis|nr:glycosyltransferase family 2 protein [Flavobacteriaceae bacterium]